MGQGWWLEVGRDGPRVGVVGVVSGLAARGGSGQEGRAKNKQNFRGSAELSRSTA